MKINQFAVLVSVLLIPVVKGYSQEKEINYIWIDAVVNIEGEETRLVSNNVTEITCCMKSPKYSRLSAKVARWIRDNYDDDFQSQNPLKSIQDEGLASKIIEEARQQSNQGQAIRIVEYEFKCK